MVEQSDDRRAPALGVEFRHLRYFVAVAEDLHFGRAAARLHIDESSLSKGIHVLEERVGLTLFDRDSHHAELSKDGKFLLPRARAIVDAQESLLGDLAARSRGSSEPRLRLLYAPLFAGILLAIVLRSCSAELPDVTFELLAAPWDADCKALLTDKADLVLYGGPIQRFPGIESIVLASCPYVVAVSALDRLAARTSIESDALADVTHLLVNPRGHGHLAPQAEATRATDRLDVYPSLETALEFVAAGRGAMTLPQCAMSRYARPDIRFVELADGPVAQVLLAARQDDRSATVAACMKVAQDGAASQRWLAT